MSSTTVSIIVPTFREAGNLPVLAQRLFAALDAAHMACELIVVDDDSRDGTDAVVADLAKRHNIRLITRVGERGLSSAVVRGLDEARHAILLVMDADLSHPPESVPVLVRTVADGDAEFVIGSRYVPGASTAEDWSFLRRLNSRGATLLARPLTSVRDPMAGFFCMRREVFAAAREAGLSPIGYKIALEILIKSGCMRVREVPIDFSDRLHGKSKMTLRQQGEYLLHLLRLYRFRWPIAAPLVAVSFVGVVAVGGYYLIKSI